MMNKLSKDLFAKAAILRSKQEKLVPDFINDRTDHGNRRDPKSHQSHEPLEFDDGLRHNISFERPFAQKPSRNKREVISFQTSKDTVYLIAKLNRISHSQRNC
jgi:hypothetical protein